MKAVLVLVLMIPVVHSQMDMSEKYEFNIDHEIPKHLCDDQAKQEVFDECLKCANETIATMENIGSTKQKDENSSKDNDNSDEDTYLPKFKKAVEECRQYLEKPDKVDECLQKDEDEIFDCLDNLYVESANRRKAIRYCRESNEKDECQECVFNGFKKGWEQTFSNKETSSDGNESENNDLDENQSTEIANNCYQYFPRPKAVKECSTWDYGSRIVCIWSTVLTEYRFGENSIVIELICIDHEREGKYHECVPCIKESNKFVDAEEDDYDDDISTNIKLKVKAATGTCGEFFENAEELMKCSKKEVREFFDCLRTIFRNTATKKLAAKFCKKHSKTDECAECVFNGFRLGWEKTMQGPNKDFWEMEESQAIEIITNCSQHIKEEEEIKQCGNERFARKMRCLWRFFSASDEE